MISPLKLSKLCRDGYSKWIIQNIVGTTKSLENAALMISCNTDIM